MANAPAFQVVVGCIIAMLLLIISQNVGNYSFSV
jgi:hypothetical protein